MLLLVAAVAVRGCHDIAMRVCVSRAGDDARVSLLSVRRRVQINERHIYIVSASPPLARVVTLCSRFALSSRSGSYKRKVTVYF